MAGYLRKYKGTYRVKADYDLENKDYPRDYLGNIEESFDDFYIDCRNNIKIRHGTGKILSCFIPSKTRTTNILRKIYVDKINEELPIEQDKYFNNLCNTLVKNNILISAEILDYEGYFEFHSNMIDYIAGLVGAKTGGANISPLSVKNLPKSKYNIPEEDLKQYQAVIKLLPTKTVIIKGQAREIVDGLTIKSLNYNFDEVIKCKMGKNFNIETDKKIKGLKGKEYIHSIGLWNEYIEFIKKEK